MLVVTGIFDNERFIPDKPVSIPQKKKVTVTIDDAVMETPAAAEKKADGKIQLTKSMIGEMLQDEDLRFLTGLLHRETTADEIRTERLKKHDCVN